jgi:hypothetical protein
MKRLGTKRSYVIWRHFLDVRLEGEPRWTSVRVVEIANEIRTLHPPNVRQKRFHLSELARDKTRRHETFGLSSYHSWNWTLLEKSPIVQLLKKFPAFYGTRRFITVFTRALHWFLCRARLIQSIPPHPISLRSILILSTHLRLGRPSGLFPSGVPTNFLYAFLLSLLVLHALPISSSLTWSF